MFDQDGYAVLENFVSPETVAAWLPELEAFRAQAGGRHSVRNLVECPLVGEIVQSEPVAGKAQEILGEDTGLVRAILFDKVPGANWTVPWHQDLTVAIAEREEVDGYGPWSVKEGVPHVQPPAEVLERMVTLRIHLDDCGLDNGPVRVIPGSHRFGRIPESAVGEHLGAEVACTGGLGSVLIMRPLLLHASSPSDNPSHRRVLHLEFAAGSLAPPLRWHTRLCQR